MTKLKLTVKKESPFLRGTDFLLYFLSRCSKLRFCSLYMHLRGKWRDCKGRSRLSARSALQSVSRFEVSTGDPRLFAAGFPIGARSIPVGTRFCSAKSSVLYLCFRLTRERGWRHTLRCGRVWQQTLFRGSRTGGFCDGGYGTNAGFLRSKIRLAGKGRKGI